MINHFNPHPRIFGAVTKWKFWEKSKNVTGDVTVGTKKVKLEAQIECQLGFVMVLISNGICQYEGKYATMNKNLCQFLGP